MASLFLALAVVIGAAAAVAQAEWIDWSPEGQSADASTAVYKDGIDYKVGSVQIHAMGGGDPLPVKSSVLYPGTCGWGWAKAQAGTGYAWSHAKAWQDSRDNSYACERKGVGGGRWTGGFWAAAGENLLFRYSRAGIGKGQGSYVIGYYLPLGSTTPVQLFQSIMTGPVSGIYQKEYFVLPTVGTSFCTLNVASYADADTDNPPEDWEVRNYVKAQACRVSDEVSCCEIIGQLSCGEVEECIKKGSSTETGGFRLRIWRGGEAYYIGACLYEPGADNSLSGQVDQYRYRWVNHATNIDKVEVYTYDCRTHRLLRVGYKSKADFDADKNPNSGELSLAKADKDHIVIYDPPPSESEAFKPPFYQSLLAARPRAALPGDRQAGTAASSTSGRFAELFCLAHEGATWRYGLVLTDWLGAMISPGNTLTFEGPGILNGQVTGNALLPAYGAWKVKQTSPGKVVFEATASAIVRTLVDDFLIFGAASTTEAEAEIKYVSAGSWIGNAGLVPGPAVKPAMSWLPLLLE